MPDDSFKEFVPDQLGALPELRAGDVQHAWFPPRQTAEIF